MADVVSVGVKFNIENLRETVTQMQNALKGVKVDSRAYKSIDADLQKALKVILELEAHSSKAFSTPADFRATEKAIKSIDESLRKAGISMGRLSFKDLKLTPTELAPIEEAQNKIKALQQSIDNFKAKKNQELLGDVGIADFVKQIDPTLVNKSFDKVKAAVDKKVKELNNKIQSKVQAAKSDIAKADAMQSRVDATAALGKTKNLSNKGMSEILAPGVFEKFFKNTDKGLSFKAGGNAGFMEWIRSKLVLDESQIQQLKGKTAKQVEEIFKGFDFGAAVNKNGTVNNQAKANAEAVLKTYQDELAKASQVSGAYASGAESIDIDTENARTQITALNAEITKLKMAVTAARNSSNNFGDTIEGQLTAQIQNFKNELARASQEFQKLQSQQMTFNSIKNAITNFMGFSQVLNLTKQKVQEAAQHIKELDKVMTEIAVVTDFDQTGLWGQIDTYSAIAQQYGVAIQGVYKISQLYY